MISSSVSGCTVSRQAFMARKQFLSSGNYARSKTATATEAKTARQVKKRGDEERAAPDHVGRRRGIANGEDVVSMTTAKRASVAACHAGHHRARRLILIVAAKLRAMELMIALFVGPCSAVVLRLVLLLAAAARGISVFRNDIAAALSQGGCADYEDAIVLSSDIIVCRGRWTGHVRNGSKLCSGSFTICSWKHKWILSKIPWSKVVETPGCYAYDAAQDGNRCGPCRANINSVSSAMTW
ncbi:unnamed protein product [Soboliphyme baturini]|uniref:SRCR domain-containing protein n=1 Tax=Soboliphyme baturini TaxID=241478 RepID=A0A183J409_9BILA|nr:unnamed protein product [Soboliphyme baturini]